MDNELAYKPEIMNELGFDIKTSLLGGVIRPNLSVSRMDAKNFQVLGRVKLADTIDLGVTRVFNAQSAYAQGAEGDVTWLPFAGGLELTPSVTVAYISSQLLDTDLEERKRQAQFLRYNARIGIGSLAKDWSFQIIGNNLTDARTSIRYGDVFANLLVSVQDLPREVLAQLRWTF